MQGILDFSVVLDALDRGHSAFRTPWLSTGQTIRKSGDGIDLVSIDGAAQPWDKPSDDLLARDWIVYTPPQGGQASPEPSAG